MLYEVERHTSGREVYIVEAESAEEAEANWMDGHLAVSEVLDSDHYKTQAVKD